MPRKVIANFHYDFSDCSTKEQRMAKMNLYVEYDPNGQPLLYQLDLKGQRYFVPFRISGTDSHYKTTVRIGFTTNWIDRSVHQLIYYIEYGDCPKGYHIHHIDCNEYNNDYHNLVALPAGVHSKYHRLKDRAAAAALIKPYIDERINNGT